MRSAGPGRFDWKTLLEAVTRPYSLSARTLIPAALLLLLVPCYIFIGELMPAGRVLHAPELSWDRLAPLQPAWVLVYGPFYAFLILLPMFVVRNEEHLRRTVLAYLTVWIVSFATFLLYPTVAPRPVHVAGGGFILWGLRLLYSSDPPRNCFPSLHVAHSFVSALSCYRVNRAVGIVAVACASLVGVSTVFTKQHYMLDVAAGILLAVMACAVFLRYAPATNTRDRQLAPVLALCIAGIVLLLLAGYWTAYEIGGIPR